MGGFFLPAPKLSGGLSKTPAPVAPPPTRHLQLNPDGTTVRPITELLPLFDPYKLAFDLIKLGGCPNQVAQIAGQDANVARRLITRLEGAMEKDLRGKNHDQLNKYLAPLVSLIARSTAHDILGELDD